jgi:hypothetical protein
VSDLADVLDATCTFVRCYVVMTAEQAAAVALWVLHTHAFEASDYTPYIFVTSAERESGKSRLKEACALLVANPVSTSNVSPAALFRIASPEDGPAATFLVDEVDEIFSPKSDRSELRGLLNAGFRRGDHAIRMVGEGARQQPGKFDVYCPKLLAGKNTAALGDTLESRCIRIELKRKTRDEHVERFRRRDVDEQATGLHEAMRSLGLHHLDALSLARPRLPDELSDREQDVWEPLLAVADLAGRGWPDRARQAAVALSQRDTDDSESLGVRLLADCRQVFDGMERISSARLIELLCLIEESRWTEKWWDPREGKAKTGAPANLAWHLRRYGIRSETLRFDDGDRLKGYRKDRFEDVWNRYLSPSTALSRDIRDNPHEQRDSGYPATRDTTPLVTAPEETSNPHGHSNVTDVTAASPIEGNEGQLDLGTASLDAIAEQFSGNGRAPDAACRCPSPVLDDDPELGRRCAKCGRSLDSPRTLKDVERDEAEQDARDAALGEAP